MLSVEYTATIRTGWSLGTMPSGGPNDGPVPLEAWVADRGVGLWRGDRQFNQRPHALGQRPRAVAWQMVILLGGPFKIEQPTAKRLEVLAHQAHAPLC